MTNTSSSLSPPPPPPSLPAELILLILRFSSSNFSAYTDRLAHFSSLSLVSKDWQIPSQALLWEHLQPSESQTRALLSSPSLGKFTTRSVVFTYEQPERFTQQEQTRKVFWDLNERLLNGLRGVTKLELRPNLETNRDIHIPMRWFYNLGLKDITTLKITSGVITTHREPLSSRNDLLPFSLTFLHLTDCFFASFTLERFFESSKSNLLHLTCDNRPVKLRGNYFFVNRFYEHLFSTFETIAPCLESLSLGFAYIRPGGFSINLEGCKKLKVLEVENLSKVGEILISTVNKLSNLETLILSCPFPELVLTELKDFPVKLERGKLKKLVLSGFEIREEFVNRYSGSFLKFTAGPWLEDLEAKGVEAVFGGGSTLDEESGI